MNILITGANGYIGQRLIPIMLEQGHTLYCCVRNQSRFEQDHTHKNIIIVEGDFLEPDPNFILPKEIDAAYYLIHSMSSGKKNFDDAEAICAENFVKLIDSTNAKQIIYLSGISNADELSKHLSSRLEVEKVLAKSRIPISVLRAGIIVGSGSASFEIIRDIIEKLPVMIAPKWLNTKCQPIAIRNVIEYLYGILLKENTYHKALDIGGPEILSYKEMLLQFAKVRGLKRSIFIVPVMTPKLSSYWLYFVTSTTYSLASNLVESMKVDVICRPNNLNKELDIQLLTYETAVKLAFDKIEQNLVDSSWKDAFISSNTPKQMMQFINVPEFGCFKDIKTREIKTDPQIVLDNIWRIGGDNGWYYGTSLWRIRGIMDRLVGGVGLRRGRTNKNTLSSGDALDFWRVLIADRTNKRLLLYAEMKLPGEAWLEFKITETDNKFQLQQVATFRPKGLWGRLYWYSVLPFHYFIFNGMINNLLKKGVLQEKQNAI
ncbi:MAG: SDR family oxidoreductase [Ferruginibacter sp.]